MTLTKSFSVFSVMLSVIFILTISCSREDGVADIIDTVSDADEVGDTVPDVDDVADTGDTIPDVDDVTDTGDTVPDVDESGDTGNTGSPDDPPVYGHAELSGDLEYLVTTESKLGMDKVYMGAAITGNIASFQIDTIAGTDGVYTVYSQDKDLENKKKFHVMQIPYKKTGENPDGDPLYSNDFNPKIELIIADENLVVGDNLPVGLLETDKVRMYVKDTDQFDNLHCIHAVGIGTLNVTKVNKTPGVDGSLAFTGSVKLYYAGETPYDGKVGQALTGNACPKKP